MYVGLAQAALVPIIIVLSGQRFADMLVPLLGAAIVSGVLIAIATLGALPILEQWFDEHNIHPHVKHEFEDSAVLKVFGQAGEGLFVGPTAIEKEICQQYSLRMVGHIADVKERFYAISIERRLKHPAVVAVSKAARDMLYRPN